MVALAAAIWRSAAAISGRRCSSSEGTPAGICGVGMSQVSRARELKAGGRFTDQRRDGILELITLQQL